MHGGPHIAYTLSGIRGLYYQETFLKTFQVHFKQGRIGIVTEYQEVLDGNDNFSWAILYIGRETR